MGSGQRNDIEMSDEGRHGLLVHTANDQLQQLKDAMLLRRSAIIKGLMPKGSGALAGELPRRLNYGPEGSDGDAQHEQAMGRVLLKFGDSHVEDRASLGVQKLCRRGSRAHRQ